MAIAETELPREATRRTINDYKERVGLTLYWLTVLVYAYFVPQYYSWNTESHLYPAFSLVDHGTFRIDAYRWGLGDISYWQGHYYSDKAPGLTFLSVPVYPLLHALLGTEGQRYAYVKSYGYFISFDMVRLRYGITFLLVVLPAAGLVWLLWMFLTHL